MKYYAGCGLEIYEEHERDNGMCDDCVDLMQPMKNKAKPQPIKVRGFALF